MTSFELMEKTTDEIHAAYKSGDVTCTEIVDRYIKRIKAYDRNGPVLNAIVRINSRARPQAEELDEQFLQSGEFVGPLHGIPLLLKDQAETNDVETTFGSIAFKDYQPEADATIVRKLRNAGAIILAKTNMPDWASTWFGYSSVLGRTKNPYALDRDPGGSSSGTAAGVAANLGAIGIGEDTGGSIRLPASFTGLYGIRVTTGLISRKGLSPLVRFQDTPGPITRTVKEIATLLDVLVGYDPEDPFTAATEIAEVDGSYTNHLDSDGLEGARLGVLRGAFGSAKDPRCAPVNELTDSAIDAMAHEGAELVDPVEIPDLEAFIDESMLYILLSKSELDGFLGDRPDAPVGSVEELYESGQYHELLELFENIAEDGPDKPEAVPEYWEALGKQKFFQQTILNTFAEHKLDAIVCPSVRTLPPTANNLRDGEWSPPINPLIASQTRSPAISVPAGITEDGLPVGVELIGKPYYESTLLELAYAYEQAADPRVASDVAPPLSE
jgi:Asp-tRNA(Asn)/Glu-tRNA(Gln) amidotransferase A subunit family amidase